MVCRQASNFGHLMPAADYLLAPVANDNRAPAAAPEWLLNVLAICACCAVQAFWADFLLWHLQGG